MGPIWFLICSSLGLFTVVAIVMLILMRSLDRIDSDVRERQ